MAGRRGKRQIAIRAEDGEMTVHSVLFKVPKSWSGSTREQLLNSAREVLKNAGGVGDNRRSEAEWVLSRFENKDESPSS